MEEKDRTNEMLGKNIITGCSFSAVRWDRDALESLNNVTKALLNITELYKGQNITIESLLKVEGNEKKQP